MRRLRQQVEGEYLVTLEGVEQDVDIAASWLLKQAEDYQKDMDIFLLKGEARAKCFKNCFKDKLDEVKEMIRSNDGLYEEKLENDRYLLTYHVRQGLMEEIGARLRMIRASIWENTIDLKEEFPDTTDQWLLLEGLRKNDVKNFEATFERNVGGQCFVHIETTSKKWGSTRRIEGNEKKGATPKKKLNPVMNFFYTGRLKSAPFSKSVIIHNTRVTVVCGDISRTTADVLVSPIGKELDMSKTAVGKALLKRFGSSVQTDLSTLESHPRDVIETVLSPDNSGGQVNVTAIYHARLAQWRPPEDSEKVKTVVKTCLALAEENRCKSIAFPLLGCGRKFKLPFDTVMSAMINATRGALSKMSSETSLQLVTFVLRSVREAQTFAQHLDELAPCPADLPTHTPHHEDKDWLLETLTTPTPTTQTMEGVHLSCGLFGSSRNILSSMRARLVQELRQTFLYEDSVEHAGLLQLSESATTQIRRAGTFESVAIARLAAGGSCLRLKGEHHAVMKVKELIQSNLLQLPVYSTSTFSSQAGCRPYRPPAYWRIAASQALMEEALQSAYKLTPVSDEERTAIENLVQATFDRRLVTAGWDAVGLRHTAISVKQVERVENPALFETYRSRRNHLLRQCEHNGKRCPPVGSIEQYSSGHVMTTALLTAGNPLLRELHLDVNEHYLFHGTRLENLQAILHHGADARLADSSGMLGSGIYFGEAFTKSDRYTDDRSKRAYGDKIILLMRVLLGTPYFSKLIKPTKFRRPPCRKCKKDRCSEDHGGSFGFFDSVIDDCTSFRAFREFVVYESTMCYPEYVITYTREG
nr:hypothetical protein BaRGS_019660 [Batillaria attramentaria]